MTKYLIFSLGAFGYLIHHYFLHSAFGRIDLPRYFYIDFLGMFLLAISAGFYLTESNKKASLIALIGLGLISNDIIIHLLMVDFYYGMINLFYLLILITIPIIGLLIMYLLAIKSNLNPESKKYEVLLLRPSKKYENIIALLPIVTIVITVLILYK